MDADAYLERIGYIGAREPMPDLIPQLHRAHLLAVPFENLDIPLGRPIALSVPAFYDKVVRRRRGGFCYELNGLFGWLLERLGAGVTLLSARVYHQGEPGAEWEAQFSFTLTPRHFADFSAECRRVQTSPESPFTRKAVCSLSTPDGRITLSGGRLIRTAGGRREEEIVTSTEEYRALLRTYFGFELEETAEIARLMALGAA